MKPITTNRCQQARRWFVLPTAVLGTLLLGTTAMAQPFTVDWTNTDGSAGTSSGGDFTVHATSGQPDAASLAGGNYTLQGGFWPGLIVPSEDAPTLLIRFLEDALTISWTPATPGFSLEVTDSLASGSWLPAPDPGANPVVIVPDGSARFFRLIKGP